MPSTERGRSAVVHCAGKPELYFDVSRTRAGKGLILDGAGRLIRARWGTNRGVRLRAYQVRGAC